MKLRHLPLLALALLAARPASAQEDLPDAFAVIDRYLEVTKLDKAIATTKARHEKGKISFGGFEGSFDSWTIAPDTKQVTIEIPGMGAMLNGFHDGHAWMSGVMGAMILDGSDRLQARAEAAYDAATRKGELFQSVKTVGKETFDGKPCWKVEVVLKPEPGMQPDATLRVRTSHEFYAVETGLLAGSRSYVESSLFTGQVATTVADYAEFDGVLLPKKIVIDQGAAKPVITLETVEFDPEGPRPEPPLQIQKMIEMESGGGAGKEPAKTPAEPEKVGAGKD